MIYKLCFQNGIKKIINLNHVSSIVLNKKVLEFKYNTFSNSGFFFFGIGTLDKEQYTEEVHYNEEKEASEVFEDIYKLHCKNLK
jgi:hypothetical protein